MKICGIDWRREMDKYEVLRVAGRGAYGTAYLARRKTDGREVILKQARSQQRSCYLFSSSSQLQSQSLFRFPLSRWALLTDTASWRRLKFSPCFIIPMSSSTTRTSSRTSPWSSWWSMRPEEHSLILLRLGNGRESISRRRNWRICSLREISRMWNNHCLL